MRARVGSAVPKPGAWVDGLLGWLDDRFDGLSRRSGRDTPIAAFLIAPAVTILGVFGVLPLILSVYLSLYAGRGINMHFVGLGNYTRALTSEAFWNSFAVTLYYVVGTVPVSLAISFVVAGGLYRVVRGRGLLRTVYFLPYVTSVVAAATVWRVLLDPRVGIANATLSALGWIGDAPPQWLLEPRGVLHLLSGGWIPSGVGPSLALVCVMLFDIWHTSGFMIVILLAGLSAIPRELEESALIDGAGWYKRNRHIVLPLLSPTLFFLLVVGVIRAFQAFNSFYALTGTGRGPLDTTQNMTVFIFTNLYQYQRLGFGAAAATLLAAAIVALTLVQWRFVGRRVHYE